MTVAAVILCATPDVALVDAAGRPAVRRIVESAWAGGAVPIIVVAPDRDGLVANALAGSSAVLAEPAPPDGGPVGQIVRGATVAQSQVSETEGFLIWPARMTWVDPETVTSLLEGHGLRRNAVLRPSFEGEPGWPVLLPVQHLERFSRLPAAHMPDELIADLAVSGAAAEPIDLGDPGVSQDHSVPLDELPVYTGPPEPAGGPPPEWGASADTQFDESPEDSPLEGPALAPYGQAVDPEQ